MSQIEVIGNRSNCIFDYLVKMQLIADEHHASADNIQPEEFNETIDERSFFTTKNKGAKLGAFGRRKPAFTKTAAFITETVYQRTNAPQAGPRCRAN